ncbi:mycothiol synthase [Naumannella huperziae]
MTEQPVATVRPPDPEAVRRLVAAATATDGTPPLNEAALRALTHPDGERHATLTDGDELLGYGQLADDHVQLVVHPRARRRGHGTALLRALAGDRDPRELRYWSFGDQPAARAWAQRAGLITERELLIMERSLTDPPPDAPEVPAGVSLRGYRPADADAVIDINARAFAHHPEQGAMDAADLASRMAEPWYRDEDLLVATRDERMIGFHWTKRHDAELGEVYVLAVDPDASSGGVGRALLGAGLAHLAGLGLRRVILYVENDQPRVVDIYRRAGFVVAHRDVVLAAPEPSAP